MKFVSWNIDGLARVLPSGLEELHRVCGSPDVWCLQEVRIRPEDHALIESMERALPGFSCGYALAHDRLNVRFRGGRAYGVATYVREDLAPRWRTPPAWDREGRLCAFELPAQKLFVANVYAVNGTDKPYLDPDRGTAAGDRHAFKRRFQLQLRDYFAEARAAGLGLVLLGDWNVSRTKLDTEPRLRTEAPHAAARALFNDDFLPALEVADVFRELHPKTRKYTWFNRVAARYGRIDAARVDFALISKPLLDRVESADIAQEQALQHGSDHAPLSLTLGLRA